EQSVQSGFDQASREASDVMQQISGGASGDSLYDADNPSGWEPPGPVYVRPDKHWRVKRGAVPTWFKQREGVRRHVQSGAARVARHRPRRSIDVR
ncbi:MAG: twin-arginine translocase subunit TatB, partial [Leptothrix sp. (in: b-proteobacteria)]